MPILFPGAMPRFRRRFCTPDGQRFACYFSMRVWRTGWTSASRFRTAVPVNPNNPTVPDLVSPPHPQFTGAPGSTAALDLGNGSRISIAWCLRRLPRLG
jgi:hypothetical protein